MKELLKLVFPVAITYLGINLMAIVDLLFVGQINGAAIGAVGFGSSIFAWFWFFGIGLTSSLEYLVSYSHGASDSEKQYTYLGQGLLMAMAVSLPLTFVLVWISAHLDWFGVSPEVLIPARDYSIILAFSLFPAYAFNVLRLFFTAKGIAAPAMILLVLGNLLNAAVDYYLVLGKGGAPALGAVGAAWATLSSRGFMLIGLLGYFLVWDRKHERKWNWNRLRYQASAMAEIFRIGFPAALQMTFEVGVFAVSTTLAASLNATDLAAHQIVLNTASLTFTIPLGVGAATAVLVGQALGKKEWQTATRVGWRGFGLGVSFMAFSCLVLLGFSESILRFFTQDEGILLVGRSILFVAALFQLSDGIQTVGTGALRGLGDTQSAMYCNLCGHWLVGLPLGALLCFRWGWGLRGIWIGLSLGLTVVAAGILIQWWRKSRKLQFLQ